MHTYTPSMDRIKEEWNRKMRSERKTSVNNRNIPSNSEPWSKCEYKTLHDILVVVDNIAKVEEKWTQQSNNS